MLKTEELKKLNIPKTPGSYQFYDKAGRLLYIGKAIDLQSRVMSYFSKSTVHTSAKRAMVKEIIEIKWIEVGSEIEALLLESNLIKKYQPLYNIDLRDDKRYSYIKVSTEEEFPRVFLTRALTQSGTFFGPFVSAMAVRETLKAMRKIWSFRTCLHLPKKACLYYRINKCPGMCEHKEVKEEYQRTIKQIILFLQGKKKKIINDKLKEIKILENKINVETRCGTFMYGDAENALANLKFEVRNINNVLEHCNILGLVDKYAADVVELAKVLGLPKVPERIEGYDISNIFGRDAVGSMVVFTGGEANKNEYRKFKIKLSEGQASDTFMLKEVLDRRLKRVENNKDSKNKEKWALPDLLIIDGGKGQLNVVVKILKKFKLDIPVIAVSKGQGLRGANAPDKIFFPGEKEALKLPLASPALHIVKRVRDEAHRFAIKYHRELRSRRWKK